MRVNVPFLSVDRCSSVHDQWLPPASEYAFETPTRPLNTHPHDMCPLWQATSSLSSLTIMVFHKHPQVILMSAFNSQYFVVSMCSAIVDARFAMSAFSTSTVIRETPP
jgi:hypothetical protein